MSVPNRAEHPRRKMQTIHGYIAPESLQEGERITGAGFKLTGSKGDYAQHEADSSTYKDLTKHYVGGRRSSEMRTNIMSHRSPEELQRSAVPHDHVRAGLNQPNTPMRQG